MPKHRRGFSTQRGEKRASQKSQIWGWRTIIKGEFELGGRKVDLQRIKMPVLTIYAKNDHIVPPATTKPINELVGAKDKELMEFPGGHIGVFVGSRSQKLLTPAVAQWLAERD